MTYPFKIILSIALSFLAAYIANRIALSYEATEYTRGYVVGTMGATFYYATMYIFESIENIKLKKRET